MRLRLEGCFYCASNTLVCYYFHLKVCPPIFIRFRELNLNNFLYRNLTAKT